MGIFDGFEIVGHRGAKAYAPENTIPSFNKALDMGATSVEFDLRVTSDGEIVVIHDDSVDRTTNGEGRVCNLTYEIIRSFDAGSWFGPEYKDACVPLFSDVLKLLKGNGGAMVEIKDEPSWDVEIHIIKTLNIIEKFEMLQQVELISFDHEIVSRFKEKEPRLKTGLLYTDNSNKWISEAIALEAQVLHPYFPPNLPIEKQMIDEIHGRGLQVLATSHSRQDIEKSIRLGVDGICSDYPDLVWEVYKSLKNKDMNDSELRG